MSTRLLGTLGTCLIAVAASGCAKSAPSPSSSVAPADAAPQQGRNRNRDIISHDELQAPGVISMSVLEAVQSLRPQYLVVRGQHGLPAGQTPSGVNGSKQINDNEPGSVHISIDGGRIGPLSDLSALRANAIKEVHYLNPAQAQLRFGGASREGPVILVVTM
jgi:hypothetical protein